MEISHVVKFATLKARSLSEQAFGDARVEDAVAVLEDIAAMLSDAVGWSPIADAPPTSGHGLHVLVFVPQYGVRSLIVEAWVNDAHPGSPWVAENGGQIDPTLWHPLPPLPASPVVERPQTNDDEDLARGDGQCS